MPKASLAIIEGRIRGFEVQKVLRAAPEVLQMQPGQLGHGLEMSKYGLPVPSGDVNLSQVQIRDVPVVAKKEQQRVVGAPDAP